MASLYPSRFSLHLCGQLYLTRGIDPCKSDTEIKRSTRLEIGLFRGDLLIPKRQICLEALLVLILSLRIRRNRLIGINAIAVFDCSQLKIWPFHVLTRAYRERSIEERTAVD